MGQIKRERSSGDSKGYFPPYGKKFCKRRLMQVLRYLHLIATWNYKDHGIVCKNSIMHVRNSIKLSELDQKVRRTHSYVAVLKIMSLFYARGDPRILLMGVLNK